MSQSANGHTTSWPSPIDKTFGNLASASDERAGYQETNGFEIWLAHSTTLNLGLVNSSKSPTNPLDLCQGLGNDLSFRSQRN